MNIPKPLILDSIFYRVPELKILDGAYLEVQPGKITALIGLNGSGKSTLMKIVSGQLKASSGISIINGERLYSKSLKKRFCSIAYLPQDSMLPRDMKVKRLIRSFPSAGFLMDDPFFKRLLRQKVLELSGGERRYLEVSLLFSLDRDFILLDEPFSGVEPKIVERMLTRIKIEVNKNRGVLLTDHLHRYVTDVADTGYLLHNRQCYRLEGDISSELKKLGYIR
ncbi:ATP-binding cassette domain-containing protein [Rhodohalobacter sp. SW132]|uniref:ATP-binding cassette domain-containing protein n=1 Tax=Rhodohalobacter sp. SW132 TaxID=2293433 RepID=UPI001315442E|nr:ATP-binding cassette domain-containing protein [Rhodohalobacter sp. SW132]